MPTYRWDDTDRPVWADMAETLLLDDGSAGDTTTDESATDFEVVGASSVCLVSLLACDLTAEARFDTLYDITQWRASGSLTAAMVAEQAQCLLDEETEYPDVGGAGSLTLEGFIGGSWVEMDTVVLTAPAIVYETTQTEAFSTGLRTIGTSTACDLRLVVSYNYTWVGSHNTVTIAINLSDFRLVGTDTGGACTASDGDYPPVEPGAVDPCACDWTEAAPVGLLFTESAPAANGFAEVAPVASSFTRRTCA